MTVNELVEAKKNGVKVKTPRGVGEVNAIGLVETYVYYKANEPGILGYLHPSLNTDISVEGIA